MINSKIEVDRILFGPNVNSYNRFEAFLKIADRMDNDIFSYACINAYESSDNTYFWRNKVKKAFLKINSSMQILMDEEELETFNSLPERITIYRGMTVKEQRSGRYGIAWTLDRKIAEFFAYKYSRNYCTSDLEKTVHSIEINKSDVISYRNQRRESTIYYLRDRDKKQLHYYRDKIIRSLDHYPKFKISTGSKPSNLVRNTRIGNLHMKDFKLLRIGQGNKKVLQINLEFLVRRSLSRRSRPGDDEKLYYEILSRYQKDNRPTKINQVLKRILALPDSVKSLQKYILYESREFGEHSKHSRFVDIIYKLRIQLPL